MERYGLPSEVRFLTGKSGMIPDRPTLILIHGAGGNSSNFLPQIRDLDRLFNILVLELPGHGNTTGPGRQTIDSYADWLHETLSNLFFNTFFLGGHSMGGAISLEMGLRYPDKIQGLILIATGATLGVSPKILTGLQEQPHQTLVKISQWSYAKGTDPQVIAQSIQLLEQTPVSVIYENFLACNQFNREEEIVQIKSPTLILVGEQDVMSPPGSSRYLHEKIPSSRLTIIPGAGHMVMLEKYKEVNQAILDFITQNT